MESILNLENDITLVVSWLSLYLMLFLIVLNPLRDAVIVLVTRETYLSYSLEIHTTNA